MQATPFQLRATGALLEGLLLVAAVAWNCWLHVREMSLAQLEMAARIQNCVEMIRKHGIADGHDFRFPTTIETVSIIRVVRDATVRLLPSNLLVEDDVILLAFGDTAPCRILFMFATSPAEQIRMESGQLFKPDLFSSITDPHRAQQAFGISTNGAYYFKVTETPIRNIVAAALDSKRPETVIAHQLALIDHIFLSRVIWIALFASLIVNALRFTLINTSTIQLRVSQAYEMLVNLQIYLLFPLIPLSYPTLSLVARSYGNAQIVSLFEALQSSKTAFEDKEDVDEFDAAPAPTKDIAVSWPIVQLDSCMSVAFYADAIWSKFLDQIIRADISFLARTTGLIESLANTTVICSIDRQGTISAPLPSPDQLFFINDSGEPVILDVSIDHALPGNIRTRFEDKDWSQHLPLLKPLGLELLLTTDCGAHVGRRRNDVHLKTQKIRTRGNVSSGRQTCLCGIAMEIGFSKDVLSQFSSKAFIEIFAPNHAMVRQCTSDYHFEIPSMFSSIFVDSKGSHQLFSEGNVEIVLESCSDYWNGRDLGQMTDAIERKIWDFYQNAVINDLQVVAYAYRPIYTPVSVLTSTTTSLAPVYLEMHDTSVATHSVTDSPSIENMHEVGNKSSTTTPTATEITDDQSQHHQQQQANGSSRVRPRAKREHILSKIDQLEQNEAIGDQEFFAEAIKGQTFLAMASVTFAPKPNVVDIIEDLGLAGIRFVYFSSAPERESKAYAEHLGLEIDWNSCIILSPEGVGPGYLAIHDMKARLPKGVENIRSHILNVDDVPLHVSLFAECQPSSIREMVRIFQEHGEVVCCIGSSLNDLNVECFAIADISISVDPLHFMRNRHGPQVGPLSPLAVAANFNSSPCALTLNVDTSLYSITQIIREARTLAGNAR
eukprot:jgi/Hompol1/1707/HPOL_005693-RA